MLKYQFVSLAKNHNYLGGVDQYMKEFARVCIGTGDRDLTNNLERVLNSEISIKQDQTERESLLPISKNLTNVVDPLFLF